MGCRSIQFIGGEPTICSLLPQLLKFCEELGFITIEVFSNLTHISDNLLDIFRTHSIRLATSVYSDIPEVHDAVTQTPGSHAMTISTIRRVVEKSIPLRVGVIEMKENAQRIAETMRFLSALGVHDYGVDQVRRIGRTADKTTKLKADQLCGQCWHGNVCVDSSGNVYPCIMSKGWQIGSLREDSLVSLIQSSRISSVRRTLEREYDCAQHDEHLMAGGNCSPKDACSPKACKPQVGGPPGCFPKTACAPKIFKWRFAHETFWSTTKHPYSISLFRTLVDISIFALSIPRNLQIAVLKAIPLLDWKAMQAQSSVLWLGADYLAGAFLIWKCGKS